MKLAIMQPYFFPYIGYFQLINAVDKLVFYDDVNFIKGGWINRNRILINEKPKFITVPLVGASQNRKTKDTKIEKSQFVTWKFKTYKTLEQHYGKRPYYKEVLPVIKEVLENDEVYIGELAKNSIIQTLNYLEIGKNIVWSSEIYGNSELKREERILNICTQENTEYYYNLIGGISIYDKSEFKKKEVFLQFLNPNPRVYDQGKLNFLPSLSIIDVLMNNSKKEVIQRLSNFELL